MVIHPLLTEYLEDFNHKHNDTNFNFLCSKEVTDPGMSGGPLMKEDQNGIWTLIAVLRGSNAYDLVEDGDPCVKTGQKVKIDDYQVLVPLLKEINEAIKN